MPLIFRKMYIYYTFSVQFIFYSTVFLVIAENSYNLQFNIQNKLHMYLVFLLSMCMTLLPVWPR